MFLSDDPLRDFDRWDAEQQELLKRIPVCDDCGYHVMDDYFYTVSDDVICESCLERNYRKEIEDGDEYVCEDCGRRIKAGHYYLMNDGVICPDCLDSYYRKRVDDYLE